MKEIPEDKKWRTGKEGSNSWFGQERSSYLSQQRQGYNQSLPSGVVTKMTGRLSMMAWTGCTGVYPHSRACFLTSTVALENREGNVSDYRDALFKSSLWVSAAGSQLPSSLDVAMECLMWEHTRLLPCLFGTTMKTHPKSRPPCWKSWSLSCDHIVGPLILPSSLPYGCIFLKALPNIPPCNSQYPGSLSKSLKDLFSIPP